MSARAYSDDVRTLAKRESRREAMKRHRAAKAGKTQPRTPEAIAKWWKERERGDDRR